MVDFICEKYGDWHGRKIRHTHVNTYILIREAAASSGNFKES